MMEQKIEKTEARQGERQRWQEHTLVISLLAAVVILGAGYLVFAAIS